MKINELSKLTGVNPETIRMYRTSGLLTPQQLSNNYYDYSYDDMRDLLHIRKLRGAGLSLDNIKYMYTHDNHGEVYEAVKEEFEALSEKIEHLRSQQAMLKLTMDHYKVYMDNPDNVVELEVNDDSYSIFPEGNIDSTFIEWTKNISFMTQSIRIPPESLFASPLPNEFPIQVGIGSYKAVLDENNIHIPDTAVLIPKGKYLTIWVTPESGTSISKKQILPLIKYADTHNYRLTGDTTAFMYRVDKSTGESKFVYRFRARYEKK